ncbi:hypothetical protein QTP88_007627 [Uroleucon formosanum]
MATNTIRSKHRLFQLPPNPASSNGCSLLLSALNQYLPIKWIFAPCLKEKLYYIIRNEEDILVKCIKVLFTTARLKREDFDNYCRYAGACDYDIGNNGNSGTNGNGGDNSGVVALGPKGLVGLRVVVNGRRRQSHFKLQVVRQKRC